MVSTTNAIFSTIDTLQSKLNNTQINYNTWLKDVHNLLDNIITFNSTCENLNVESKQINPVNYICNRVNSNLRYHILRTLNLHEDIFKRKVNLNDFKNLILPHAFKIYKNRLNCN